MAPNKAGIVDCSAEVDEGVKKWSKVAIDEKRLHEAIDGLLVLEKKCRNGEDHESGQKVASCIVKLCYDLKDFEALKANLTLLSKRRGQLKQVIKAAVQTCMECMESLAENQKDLKIDLIEVLRTITEGKIFVENERARLTQQLAAIREADGQIKEAAEMMQEIQVETYGAMDKREKSEFILEQIRLCLDSYDNIRALILSDKISAKLLADVGFQDIKLRYHTLMIRYFTRKENFLAICRAYLEMFHTPIVQDKAEDRDKYLKAAALFCALAPYDHDQSDLAHRIQENKFISDLPAFKKMLKSFTTVELIAWQPFEEAYRAEIDKMEIFFGAHTTEPLSRSSDDLMSSSSGETSLHTLVWEALQKRVTEHNIRVVAQHYSRIQTSRLCELLHLAEHETEQYVSALVSSKTIYAKIDRSQRIISFQKSKQASEQLNEWSNDIGQLLQSLERVSHLIHRENMVHKMSE